MGKLFEKLNKLSLPAVILIASLILGGFFYASQVNKQRSIEQQQEIKLQEVKRTEEAKAEQAKLLDSCLNEAEEELNRKTQEVIDWGNRETTNENVSEMSKILQKMFDDLSKTLEEDKAECFKRYPQK